MNDFVDSHFIMKFNSSSTFSDEIIRQVTINCTERGLLLLRVRDEINMRDEAYERRESSIFSMLLYATN